MRERLRTPVPGNENGQKICEIAHTQISGLSETLHNDVTSWRGVLRQILDAPF